MKIDISLPPLVEQKRIALILMEGLAIVDRARAAAEAQLKSAKALPAAYLRDVFATSHANGHQRPIGEVCQLLPSKSIAIAGDTEVRAITTACLTESGFDPAGIKTARMWSSDVKACVVAANEVLVARSNTPELVGRVAMFPGEPKGTVASDLTIRIWAGQSIEPQFLASYLSNLYVTGYWREKAGGASGTMKKITRSQIDSLPVPILEIEKQRAIVRNVRTKMTQVRELEGHLRDNLHTIEALPAALLRSVFHGQLGTQHNGKEESSKEKPIV
jgi:type I restriction enzyme S subunit